MGRRFIIHVSHTTNDEKGVFHITVDSKSLQIEIAITNFVFIKLLQNINSKCYFKK